MVFKKARNLLSEQGVLSTRLRLDVERVVTNDSGGTIVSILVNGINSSTTSAKSDGNDDTNDDTNDGSGTKGSTNDDTGVVSEGGASLRDADASSTIFVRAVVEITFINTSDGDVGGLFGVGGVGGRRSVGVNGDVVELVTAVVGSLETSFEGLAVLHSALVAVVIASGRHGQATKLIAVGVRRRT